MILKSYIQGRWHDGGGERAPLYDPTTEAVIAETSTAGIDFGAALEYARTKGGPALRQLTFAARGRLVSAMANALHAHREELVELAIKNGGNTRGDAKFDIDGCTGTLAYYGKVGEALGDRRFLTDGALETLMRAPRFVGGHLLVPREGVAVHVNAFNFPAWGFGEKAAVALLAGMPVVTKPATSTALVAARIMEILVEADVLPAGALSFVAGSPGDMLTYLGPQDVLAFTGSADTGAKLRAGKPVVRDSVRTNVEADSLNSAVLGPDVEEGSDTFDLFIREVANDVTQKAGQKCTAIRRVFVPRGALDAVIGALSARVSEVRVGDPSLKEVRMGPVATAGQLRDVRAGIELLRTVAEPVLGDGGRGKPLGVDGDKGYFVSPTLLLARDPANASPVHSHEVFGPCATLMPYSGDPAEAIGYVRRGQGGLVASVYSDDKDFASAMLFGIAPYHGRLHLGSARIAEHSPGPGTVLPNLVHGGPGRAGGGEELGGERGLRFYMQRTAVQGEKTVLEKLLGG